MPKNPAFNVALDLAVQDLLDFDKVGFLYVMESKALQGSMKIGVTAKPPEIRAMEVSLELKVQAPFTVSDSWRFRNYKLAERFLQHRLYCFREEYVKEIRRFNEVRTSEVATRTHRSVEVFKCSFQQVLSEVSLLLRNTNELLDFERAVAAKAKDLLLYWGKEPETTKAGFILQNVIRLMNERLDVGDTSICIQSLPPSSQDEFLF